MKYFSIDELCRSDTAAVRGIDNWPTPGVKQNLERLVANVLDPLREAWGAPLKVNSGYRSTELNKAVKGAKNSHHIKGMAADISAGSRADNKRLFQLVLDMGLPFTQLIDEKNYSWVHISYDSEHLKKQVLRL